MAIPSQQDKVEPIITGWILHWDMLAQSQSAGFCQVDGLAGAGETARIDDPFRGSVGFVGVSGLYLAARSARFPWALGGGDVVVLGAADGGAGHERRDGEKTPLLAMLTPPTES